MKKRVALIPQWKQCWRRYSTYLILAIPVLEAAREFMPEVRELISPEAYKMISGVLAVSAFIAIQIKQNSVSGAVNDEQDETDKAA